MSDIVNDYFKTFYPPAEALDSAEREFSTMLGGMTRIRVEGYNNIFPPMKCVDGFEVSVQGHYGAYSLPRDDFAERYTRVELGFPSAHEPLLDEYQDGDGDPTQTVYGYVPVEIVEAVIDKHGGLAPQDNNGG